LPPAATAPVAMTALPNATATTTLAILCILMTVSLFQMTRRCRYAVCVSGIKRCREQDVFTASDKHLLDLAAAFSGLR
jgi:hypothetical protein